MAKDVCPATGGMHIWECISEIIDTDEGTKTKIYLCLCGDTNQVQLNIGGKKK